MAPSPARQPSQQTDQAEAPRRPDNLWEPLEAAPGTDHGAHGEFRTAQVHAKVDMEKLRALLNELIDSINDAEDEANALQTITIAFHPSFERGEPD